jgi:UDP-N-acetylglucosamine 2-epimerase (non-hydrolysing)
MIIVLKNGTAQEDINKISGWLSRYNVEVCPIVGAETTILGVPCLTLRDNTERPITVEAGTNRVVGTRTGDALRAALETLAAPPHPCAPPPLWDGKASGRIVDVLEQAAASI